MKVNLLLLGFGFFAVTAIAMEEPKLFEFSDEYLRNDKILKEASEFCNNNKQNLIILVEDTRMHRTIMIRNLKEKFAIITFERGDYLLHILQERTIDGLLSSSVALILDNQMPGKHGLKVMAEMVKNGFIKSKSQCPLAVLNTSDNRDELNCDELKELENFSLVLTKKNNWQEILKELRKLGDSQDSQDDTQAVLRSQLNHT